MVVCFSDHDFGRAKPRLARPPLYVQVSSKCSKMHKVWKVLSLPEVSKVRHPRSSTCRTRRALSGFAALLVVLSNRLNFLEMVCHGYVILPRDEASLQMVISYELVRCKHSNEHEARGLQGQTQQSSHVFKDG